MISLLAPTVHVPSESQGSGVGVLVGVRVFVDVRVGVKVMLDVGVRVGGGVADGALVGSGATGMAVDSAGGATVFNALDASVVGVASARVMFCNAPSWLKIKINKQTPARIKMATTIPMIKRGLSALGVFGGWLMLSPIIG